MKVDQSVVAFLKLNKEYRRLNFPTKLLIRSDLLRKCSVKSALIIFETLEKI